MAYSAIYIVTKTDESDLFRHLRHNYYPADDGMQRHCFAGGGIEMANLYPMSNVLSSNDPLNARRKADRMAKTLDERLRRVKEGQLRLHDFAMVGSESSGVKTEVELISVLRWCVADGDKLCYAAQSFFHPAAPVSQSRMYDWQRLCESYMIISEQLEDGLMQRDVWRLDGKKVGSFDAVVLEGRSKHPGLLASLEELHKRKLWHTN